MEPRNVLYVNLSEGVDTALLEKLLPEWMVHKAEGLQSSQRLIDDKCCQVGIVSFGPRCEELCTPELQSIIFANPGVNWVAVLQKSALDNTEIQNLIARFFYDHHHLSVDISRLKMTLGHAYGRAQLARQFTEDRSVNETLGIEEGLVGSSTSIQKLRSDVNKISRVDAPVLITGESGTGKEVAAHLIHKYSRRASGPFVAVNCAALSANLIQAELFGHEKGSFTGAHKQRIGRIEAANNGTIFLDEIGDLPPDMQIILLRFLDEQIIERVGGHESIPVDVRVIAATNVDLQCSIEENIFREDLYYRLKVLCLQIPNLCGRGQDVEVLANYFIDKFRDSHSTQIKGLSYMAIQALYSYHWPGNVRELMNTIRRALVMSNGPLILPEDLGLERRAMCRRIRTLEESRGMAEEAAILNAFDHAGSNITQAAEHLNISRGTLYRLMEKHDITWPKRPVKEISITQPSPDFSPDRHGLA
jgi:DNA-binding NtrC family response regulator